MNLVNYFLIKFLSAELLPTLMQNIGIAFIAILIPLVLFIFSMEEEYLFEWDKIVILDKVINAKHLIISFGLIFFPLFFWNYDSYILKFILFLIFLFGVSYMISILFNSYRWIKTVEIKGQHDSNSFRNILRNKYLEEVTNLSEKEKVWSLTWRKDIPNILDERNFIKKFIINIDTLVNNDSLDMLMRYLQIFNEFIDKRSLYDSVIFRALFPRLLEWNFLFFKRENQEKEIDTKRWYIIYEIETNLKRLIERFVLSSLQKANSFLLFKILKEQTNGKDVNFLKSLFSQSICSIMFENVVNSNQHYDIWNHYFPNEWKITKETLEDPDNIMSRIWLRNFFQWAPNRILSVEEGNDFDEKLDDVAKELFPSVEPIMWAKILTFLFRPWSNNYRIKSLVEKRPNFGAFGRVYTSWDSEGKAEDSFFKAIEEQSQATIEIALILFPSQFTKVKLEKFITELNALKYDDGMSEESQRRSFVSLFEKMISLVDQSQKGG
jgi:hypothetical protein